MGAAVLLVSGCGSRPELPTPRPLTVERGPSDRYLRGVNSYTVNYTGTPEAVRGEPPASYTYLAARGHQLVRLPFEWGNVQPQLGGPLDPRLVAVLEQEVSKIAAAGMRVILDVHSSGRHPTWKEPQRSFESGISQAQFNDVWLRLSERFGGDPRIYAYDLMNEPFDLPDEVWQSYSQGAVRALRAHGDRTLLWIEGNEYSHTAAWREHQPRPWIEDPIDHHVYSAHCYPGNAGNEPEPAPTPEDQRQFLAGLRDFVDWLAEHGCRGSIGEVGWPSERAVGEAGARAWDLLGEAWYEMADAARLDVTYFGASSAYDNHLWAYDAYPDNSHTDPPGLRRAHSQAAVIEAHGSRRCVPAGAPTAGSRTACR